MSLQEKHKLYISEIQNLHFEFEDLVNKLAKKFRTEVLIPFCNQYEINFVIYKYKSVFLKDGINISFNEDLWKNENFVRDYEIINDILELYIGLKDMSFYEYVGNYTYTQKYYEN